MSVFTILLLTLSEMVVRYHYSSSPSGYLSNNISGLTNANFVDTVLQDLMHRDLIVKCNKHLLLLIHNSF
jgi:hypothetical protein